MNLIGWPGDNAYGNGPYVANKTKCTLRDPYYPLSKFDTWDKIHVGDWGSIFCEFYTA